MMTIDSNSREALSGYGHYRGKNYRIALQADGSLGGLVRRGAAGGSLLQEGR